MKQSRITPIPSYYREPRKLGILERPKVVDPDRLAGKPYKQIVWTAAHRIKEDEFYQSREWFDVRYRALRSSDGKCQLCGRNKHDNIKLHVDHIKPRSKYPHRELDLDNLQILCNECNFGKSNKDETDWRST